MGNCSTYRPAGCQMPLDVLTLVLMTLCSEDDFVQLGLSLLFRQCDLITVLHLLFNVYAVRRSEVQPLPCISFGVPVSDSFYVSNLVDSASSHTLVSKIKPCMSKYKYFTLKLRTAHYISYSLFDSPLLLGYP